jgi:branched-chain amino acid transport system substrate-binding protein
MGLRKSGLFWTGAVAAMTLGLAACSGGSSTSAESADSAAPESSAAAASDSSAGGAFDCKDGAIKIGAVKALTGGFSFYDGAGSNSDALAIEEINAQGGIGGCMIEMTVKDMKSDPALGGQVAKELIQGGAQVILVPNDKDLGLGAAQAAQAAGVFSLSPGGASQDFGASVGPLFANGGTTSQELARAAARFSTEQGYKSVFYITNESFAFFTLQEDTFKAESGLADLGRVAVENGQTDFSAVVTKAKDALASGETPMIYLASYFPDAAVLVKQLREGGVTAPIVGNSAFSSRDFAATAGVANVKDVYYAAGTYFEGTDVPEDAKAFTAAYEAKYGEFPPNSNPAESYWTMWAFFDALEAAGSTNAEDLAAALLGQKNLTVPLKTIAEWQDQHIVGSTVVIGFTDSGDFKLAASYGRE